MNKKKSINIPGASSIGEVMADPSKYMVTVRAEKKTVQKTTKKNKIKKKRGRPKKYNCTTWIRVYLDWETKKKLKECAKQQHISLTGLLQGIIWEWMQGRRKKPIQMRRGHYDDFKFFVVAMARILAEKHENTVMMPLSTLLICATHARVQPRLDTLARYLMRLQAEGLADVSVKTIPEMVAWLKSYRRVKIINFQPKKQTRENLKQQRQTRDDDNAE